LSLCDIRFAGGVANKDVGGRAWLGLEPQIAYRRGGNLPFSGNRADGLHGPKIAIARRGANPIRLRLFSNRVR